MKRSDTPSWRFWNPHSGFFGGLLFGVLVVWPLIYALNFWWGYK